jgi:hypothetical protein
MSSYDPRAQVDQAWQATRAQTALATQILRDENDYLAAGARPDIGRQVSPDVRELFVSCEPALALQQQFEHLQPEYIAVHDVGTTSSRKLLAGIASAAGRPMQKLVIRRQGFGTPLATLGFVDLPTTEGGQLRLFTTEADADTAARHGVARVLLAFSRLAVLMVGDLPAHVMASTLKPLHDSMLVGPWHNRHLLMLPLASPGVVTTQGSELARGTGVDVRTTPQVTRPSDAWGFISSTWGRVRDPMGATPTPSADRPRPMPPIPNRAAAANPSSIVGSLSLRPMPDMQRTPPQGAEAQAPAGLLDRYVRRLNELAGMVSCCVFDIAAGRPVAHAGSRPDGTALATRGAEMIAALTSASRTLGLGHALPDAAVTLGAHHLVLRPVPRHPGLALHAVLDKATANLTLARLQIQRLDAVLDEPA